MAANNLKQLPALSKEEAARYWESVNHNGNARGCWLWRGSTNSKGYGRFFLRGKHLAAHRLSWLLAGRAMQADLLICHTCDNKACVNPDHLIMGDDATNARDAKLKRNLRGKHAKVRKPYPTFPLFPHPTRRWAKKVRGKTLYFGSTIKDPTGEAALALWEKQKDDLRAGRKPREEADGLTVRDLVNQFLTAKQHKASNGEMSNRMFLDYHSTCGAIVAQFGATRLVADLRPDDFSAFRIALAKRLGPVALGNAVVRVRSVFKYAFVQEKIEKPVAFGDDFKKPDKKVIRKLKGERAPRMFEAAELRKIIEAAGVPLKAMILLGINAGFGNSDCGNLPIRAVDLAAKWVRFPRPKTGVERRCPLWPETIEALKAAIDGRPKAKDEANGGLIFITKQGLSWHKDTPDSPIAKEFRKLVDELGVHRERVGFYSLRHTFQTIADEARDPVAAALIMGHVDESMSDHYRERIGDDRLAAVVNHVRAWLFPPKGKAKPKAK